MKDHLHLDPFHLQSFLAVAETLHFTSAAQKQGVSQSTISQHVSRLEEQLGTRLLARSTKSVRLTEDGMTLIGLARGFLHCEDNILSHFRSGSPRGSIRVGVTEDLLLTRFPEILGTFRASHPTLQVTLISGLSFHLMRLLEQNEIDLFCGMRRSSETVGRRLWTEDLRWFASEGTTLTARDSIPLVTFPDGSLTRRLAIETLNRAGQPWHLAFTSDSLIAILAAVRAGYGVTPQPAFLENAEHITPCLDNTLPVMPPVEFIASTQQHVPQGPEDLLIQTLCAHISRSRPDFLTTP
ncbi:LysR family transcriptional regulator [Gluconobacter morbifer]|nr:LysR family transcriptional regulator [Gluconobacter morbifer]